MYVRVPETRKETQPAQSAAVSNCCREKILCSHPKAGEEVLSVRPSPEGQVCRQTMQGAPLSSLQQQDTNCRDTTTL